MSCGAGITMFAEVLKGGGSLALPHLSAPDISHIAWRKLKAAGVQGCVFDKVLRILLARHWRSGQQVDSLCRVGQHADW